MDLSRYQPLYARGHTYQSGAARVANRFLGLSVSDVVPLSLSHGVDYGHTFAPMDVSSIEPLHWCYNNHIALRTREIKRGLKLPHPWLMLCAMSSVPQGIGTLVVGPPPGPENDLRLLRFVQDHVCAKASILVKRRGNYQGSEAFWRDKQFEVVSADNSVEAFYSSLFVLLSRFRRVVSGTFSSALIFAAALGKEALFLPGYRYRSYFPTNYLRTVDFNSTTAKQLVEVFIGPREDLKQTMAREVLGETFLGRPEQMLSAYQQAVDQLEFGCHGIDRWPAPMRSSISRMTSTLRRPGIPRMNIEMVKRLIGTGTVLDVELDEVSVWRNGPDSSNFSSSISRFVRGRTEPGSAVCQYDAEPASGAPS